MIEIEDFFYDEEPKQPGQKTPTEENFNVNVDLETQDEAQEETDAETWADIWEDINQEINDNEENFLLEIEELEIEIFIYGETK